MFVLANQFLLNFCWILKNQKNGSEILHLALRSASNMPALQWTPDFFYPFNVSGTWNRNAASLTLGAKRCELLPIGPNCESRPQPEVSGYNLLIKFPDPKPSEVPFSHIGRLRAFELTQIRCVYIHIVHILYI